MAKAKQRRRRSRVGKKQPTPASRWSWLRNRLHNPWMAGIAATVIAAIVGVLLLGIGREALDLAAMKDWIRALTRSDSDIRYTVAYIDDGFDTALPEGIDLTPAQKTLLRGWSIDQDSEFAQIRKLQTELRAKGGASPRELTLRLTLEGRRNQDINVDDIRAVNVRRSPIYAGTFLFLPPQESGNVVEMLFDFDEARPRARVATPDPETGQAHPGELFFQAHTLTLKDAQEDELIIRSRATRWAVAFEIRIDYRIGDQSKHLIINDHGRPFRLTPMHCADRTQLADDGSPTTFGHASYQQIWKLRDDYRGIAPARNPERFELGPPYC